MAGEPHVLIVDDERDILDPLASYLSKNGLRVSKARDAAAAREILAAHAIDIALIDIMMPGEDGLSLTGFIRATSKIPVILLTAKAEETDRIVGLELGADDYVTKPFSPARAARPDQGGASPHGGRSACTRPMPRLMPSATGCCGPASASWSTRTGRAVPLSTGEYNLLLAFVTHPRRVLTRDQLLDLSQGRELGAFERSIDNHISRLRKKIEADPRDPKLIKTVWGGGYMLAAEVRRL